MEYTFKFDSDFFSKDGSTCDVIEVTINVQCSDRDGSHETEIISLYNETRDEAVELEAFPANEQAKLEQRAQDHGDDNAYDAWQNQMEGAADAAYDSYKDSLMEDN
jgi:hypothetical protein